MNATGVHHFSDRLKRGETVERDLDEHFAQAYGIRRATMREQRTGIDRVFTDGEGAVFKVEYKADWRAAETGNVFVETVSVDTQRVDGWAYTSRADWLVYAFPQERRYFLVRLGELREKLPEWLRTFPRGKARNATYHTHGVLVPLAEFETLAHHKGVY
jgi:hypothetical protein